MKKTFVIILLLAALLLIAGCGGSKTQVVKGGFIGGSNGVTAKITMEPSNEILDNNIQPFRIVLNLENSGESRIDTNNLIATLDGIDLDAYQIQQKDGTSRNIAPLEKLRSESGKILPASQDLVIFEGQYKNDIPADKTEDLTVNFCYKYETVSVGDSCLVKEPTLFVQNPKCKINEQKVVSNSGSPVKVTLMNQRPTGAHEISFDLHFENVGKGGVFSNDLLAKGKCSDPHTSDITLKNKIAVKVEFPDSNPTIKCNRFDDKNFGTLVLIGADKANSKAVLSCRIDSSNLQDTAFVRQLRVSTGFVYRDSVSTKVTIKSVQ